MEALTPAERRGALALALLLALGAGHDLWRASRPVPASPTAGGGVAASPRAGAGDGPGAGPVVGPADAAPAIDLNRATALELESLPGVGPVLAGRIVAHRERHGPFRHPEELLAVRGIGPRLFERLRGRVRTGSGGRPGPTPGTAPPGAGAPP